MIDMPEIPGKPIWSEEARMFDIKVAAFALLKQCVFRGDHLGGIVMIGRRVDLQMRLEGREDRRAVE